MKDCFSLKKRKKKKRIHTYPSKKWEDFPIPSFVEYFYTCTTHIHGSNSLPTVTVESVLKTIDNAYLSQS